MKDLEQFIKDNREAFDSYEPGGRVWKNLQAAFPAKQVKRGVLIKMNWKKWLVAAAVMLVIISGMYLLTTRQETARQTSMATNDIPAEYAQEVYHFTRLIELKHKELDKIRKEEPELYKKFSADIFKLDSSYQMLKKELPGNPNEEMVIEAMIENLRIQTTLLTEQLTIIRKIKQNKKTTNEKNYRSA